MKVNDFQSDRLRTSIPESVWSKLPVLLKKQ